MSVEQFENPVAGRTLWKHEHGDPIDNGPQLLIGRNPHTPPGEFAKAVGEVVRVFQGGSL